MTPFSWSAALAVSRCGGAERVCGERRHDDDDEAANARQEEAEDEGRRRVALVSTAEGTSPERGRESKNAARASLGDGIVKPPFARIEWTQLLRHFELADVLACPCGGRRAVFSDISERDVVVAIVTHLDLPTEAPPIARARSPAFDFA